MFWQHGEELERRLSSSPAWFDHLFLRTGRSGQAMSPITFYSQQTSLQYVRYRSINSLPLPRLTTEERLKEITKRRPDLLPLHEERQEDRQRNRGNGEQGKGKGNDGNKAGKGKDPKGKGKGKVCPFYNSAKGCMHGSQCRYLHEAPAVAAHVAEAKPAEPAPKAKAKAAAEPKAAAAEQKPKA